MIHTDGRPTIVSDSRENREFAAADDRKTVQEAETITANAVAVKCPTCEAPDNGEEAPSETGSLGRYGQFAIYECGCCGECWHQLRP